MKVELAVFGLEITDILLIAVGPDHNLLDADDAGQADVSCQVVPLVVPLDDHGMAVAAGGAALSLGGDIDPPSLAGPQVRGHD